MLNSDEVRFGGTGTKRAASYRSRKGDYDGKPYSIGYSLPAYGVAVFQYEKKEPAAKKPAARKTTAKKSTAVKSTETAKAEAKKTTTRKSTASEKTEPIKVKTTSKRK